MVGAAQFEMISRRLDQVARSILRSRGIEPPEDMGGFGGLGVVLTGDFGQLPPVLSSSLLAYGRPVESSLSGLRGYALQGQRRFQGFCDVVRLRRIHRQKEVSAFKASTPRPRDPAIAATDYELWKVPDVQTTNTQPT